jgi:peroxiredoxin
MGDSLGLLHGLTNFFTPWYHQRLLKYFPYILSTRRRENMSDVAAEIKVGDAAPDFTLKDQDQKDIKLSDYKGKKNVVLAFYPLDWSPVCTGENKCLTDDFPSFESANAEIMGVSCDSFFSHKAWADSLDLKHKLLADMHRTVSKAYGLYFEPLNCSKRATVVVDKSGKVAYAKVQDIKTARDDKEILEALKKLK